MTQHIGNDTLLGTAAGLNLSAPKKLSGTTQETVLAADQKIIAVHVGWAPGNGSGTATGSIKVCLYDQGNAATNKPKIAGTDITINYDTAVLGSSPRWISVTGLDIDLSAHAGKTLCPGIAPPSASANSGFSILLGTVSGAVRTNTASNSTTPPDPFVPNGSVSSNQAWSLYFETETITSGGTVSLDSVTPLSQTNAGQFTAVFSGNAASGTVDLIADGVTVAQTVTSWTYNAGTEKTTVVSNVVQGGLAFGAATIRYTTSSTFSEAVTLVPISGNAKTNIVSPLNTEGYIFEQLATGNYLDVIQVEYTDSPNTVISADGLISQTVVRAFQARALDGNDDTWSTFSDIYPHYSYEFAGSGGISSSGNATISKGKSFTGSGNTIFSGSAILSKSKNFGGSGGFSSLGSATVLKVKNFSPSGGFFSSGSADYEFNTGDGSESYEFEGYGSLVSSGNAIISKSKNFNASGIRVFSGSAIYSFSNQSYVPSLRRTLKILPTDRTVYIN